MNSQRTPSSRLDVPDFDAEAKVQAMKDLNRPVEGVKDQSREELQKVITGTVEDKGLYEMMKGRAQRSASDRIPGAEDDTVPPRTWRKDINVEPL